MVLIACGYACGSNQNTLMTSLINERKIANDSLTFYQDIMKHLNEEANNPPDSIGVVKMLDSGKIAVGRIEYLEPRIAALTFSIDSLSKMK